MTRPLGSRGGPPESPERAGPATAAILYSDRDSTTTPPWVSITADPQFRYSDRDSEKMRRKRRRDRTFGVAMSLAFLGLLSFYLAGMLALAWGHAAQMVAVIGLWAPGLVVAAWLLHYTFIRGTGDALRQGYFLTKDILHFNDHTVPVSSILRAEVVMFYGYRDTYLAIDHGRTTLGRKWVGTALIGSKDTASIEILRDAIRSVKGWPPQVLDTRTTWGDWRKAAKRIWKEAAA